jgi:hypothetical protein
VRIVDASLLRLRLSEVKDVFDLSALDKLIADTLQRELSVLSENQMEQQDVTAEVEECER